MSFGASLYKPGDYTMPHTDVSERDGQKRRVAFILHLAADWNPSWGGDLVMMGPTAHILPIFNAITFFPTSIGSWHFVSPVAEHAPFPQFKRLALSGRFMTRDLNDAKFKEELGADRDQDDFGSFAIDGRSGRRVPTANRMVSDHVGLRKLMRIPRRRRQRKNN